MTSLADNPAARARARGMTVAGIALILLSAGAALLPAEKGISSDVIGAMLVAAGLIEIIAASLRRGTRIITMLAGGLTVVAGLLFLLNADARFFPTVNIVIAWLVLRAIALAVASRGVSDSVRRWTVIAAATDLLLAVILLIGLSLSTVVVLIFGPTPAIVATFSWIVALSFVATGLLMLEVASCVREASN